MTINIKNPKIKKPFLWTAFIVGIILLYYGFIKWFTFGFCIAGDCNTDDPTQPVFGVFIMILGLTMMVRSIFVLYKMYKEGL